MASKQQIQALIQKQRWQDAKSACTQYCNANPNDAEAWFLLGAICGQLGAFAESEEACRRSLALYPNMPMTHANLGIALRQQGKLEEAIATFGETLRLKPDLAQAHNELGVALQLAGKLVEAAECYRKAIAYQPDYAQAFFNLGTAMAAQGQFADAIATLQQAIKLNSNYPEAHFQLGEMYRGQKRSDEAIAHYRQALKLQPNNAFAWNALAGATMDGMGSQDAYEQAEKAYKEAIRHQSNIPEFYLNLGVLLREQGRHDEAMTLFRKAVELRPGYDLAIAGMARVLEHRGDFAGAYSLLAPLAEGDSQDATVAMAYAAVARHVDKREAAVELLEKLVQQPKHAHELRAMHFTVGNLYDAMKVYDRAFEHYREAHAIDPSPYNPAQEVAKFDALIEVFSAENLASLPHAANRSQLPVFIVGMPRSGTSLVEQIIASHPSVFGAGELGDVHRMTLKLPEMLGGKVPYPQCVRDAKRKHFDELSQRHLAMLGKFSKTATRVTDKMPHNFLALGLIELLFPGARVIHCKRNPIDTCFSIYSLPFNVSHAYVDDLAHLGAYYRQYQRLMEHWKSALHIPYMEVQYEDLVENQEAVTRQLIDFCGLDWDERCLRFHEADRVVTTHSYDQVRRPLYKKSVARWKHYEAGLGPLIEALGGTGEV